MSPRISTAMLRTTLTSLDKIELAKETIATSKDNAAIVRAVLNLIAKAGFLKAKPEDVRGWIERHPESRLAHREQISGQSVPGRAL